MAEEEKRLLPRSELEFNLLMSNTVWGSSQINPELKEKLIESSGYYDYKRDKEGKLLLDDKGEPIKVYYVEKKGLWALLGFYTRDLRLGNLSTWNGELATCNHYLNLANDFLQADMIKPFLISLSRVASILELSQSKGGFFRRRLNTFTQEHFNTEMEPKKKTLFGKSKEE